MTQRPPRRPAPSLSPPHSRDEEAAEAEPASASELADTGAEAGSQAAFDEREAADRGEARAVAEANAALDQLNPDDAEELAGPVEGLRFEYFGSPADLYYTPRPPARFGRQRSRRNYIGGSDARIIMSGDEDAVVRLWREKRGEIEPQDLSNNLVVQLGHATESLNRIWYIRNTGRGVSKVQSWVRHPVVRWMAATLDGFVEEIDAVFEAKFMLPWSFSEDAALAKHMAQLQHNMWVTNARSAVLSIVTGGGKWIEMTIPADALYQHFLLTAERHFWRCVKTGERPRPYGLEPPTPPMKAVRVVDMEDSNSWAQFADLFASTRSAFLDHERAKAELKALMPEDVKEAAGHGVRGRRSKSGAVTFDLLNVEGGHATLQ